MPGRHAVLWRDQRCQLRPWNALGLVSAGRVAPNALQRQPRVAIEHVRRNIGIAQQQENEHIGRGVVAAPEGSGNCFEDDARVRTVAHHLESHAMAAQIALVRFGQREQPLVVSRISVMKRSMPGLPRSIRSPSRIRMSWPPPRTSR